MVTGQLGLQSFTQNHKAAAWARRTLELSWASILTPGRLFLAVDSLLHTSGFKGLLVKRLFLQCLPGPVNRNLFMF